MANNLVTYNHLASDIEHNCIIETFLFLHYQNVSDPTTAPVAIWLQGGPGGSSMFGLLEIHGPIQAVFDGNGGTTGKPNLHSWSHEVNMIYIDNPVGAGKCISARISAIDT